VEFSSDGNLLATGSDANLARVWNWKDGKEIPKFQHGDTVVAVGFDRSGTRLASGSDDNTALVWNIDTGREEKRFNLASPVRAVRFSMDGSKLSTVSLNGAVGTWSMAREDPVMEACTRLPRNLTELEWNFYIGEEIPYGKTCPKLP